MNINRVTDEELAAEIHKVYCIQYQKRFGKAYYTNGNYSKLDEPTKDYDRALVPFIRQCVKDSQKELIDALKESLLYADNRPGDNWGYQLCDILRKTLASVEEEDSHVE